MAGPVGSSSHIRACKNCATAKARCSGYVSSAKCERYHPCLDSRCSIVVDKQMCNRLRKECVPQVTVRKTRPPKTATPLSEQARRVTQLEQTVSVLAKDLITVMSTGQQADLGDKAPILTPEVANSGPASSLSPKPPPPLVEVVPGFVQEPSYKCVGPNQRPTINLEDATVYVRRILSTCEQPEDPDVQLNRFRDNLATQVPWIVIQPSFKATDLLRKSPFLYLTIILATSYDNSKRQRHLGQEAIRYISERLIQGGEKTLDILQGITVLLSWYQEFIYNHSQINNLLQLLFSLMTDLSLYKVTPRTRNHEAFLEHFKPRPKSFAKRGPGTSEERRIVIGCFYIYSCFTLSLSRLDPPRFTTNTDECCSIIASAAEYTSDTLLVSLVKLQRIAERIRKGNSRDDPAPLRAPVGMHVKVYRAELQDFYNSIPPDLQQNTFLLFHYHAVEVLLYEACFSTVFEPTLPLQRTELLYACYKAASALFDIFFSIPVENYFILTLVNWGQLFQGLAAIAKLCMFESEAEDFDLAHMRNLADLTGLAAKISERLERAMQFLNSDGDNNMWASSVRNLKRIKPWYDARLVEESVSRGQTLQSSNGTLAEANEVPFETHFEFDAEFWQEVDNGWGFWGIPNVDSL